jgi:hypothetical protein
MQDERHKDYTHFFCICCGKPTTQLGMGMDEYIVNREHKLESMMWDDAIVDTMAAGYGSIFDGDVFYVAVCDKCTDKALKDGRLAYKNNYMGMNATQKELDEWERGYKKRMRDVNLGDIIDD